ncbi:Protein unc-93 A [Mactra antiquata]
MEKGTEEYEFEKKLLKRVENDKAIIQVDSPADTNERNLTLTKHDTIRNLIVICVSFVFLFSAFCSFASLQSSLNKEEGLGTTGQAVLYAAMVLSSLLLTSVTMSKISQKWIMVVSMFTYLIFVATGFYPSWYTIMPASVLIGIGAAHLWSAVQTYITDLAKHYAFLTGTEFQDRLNLFLGILYAFMY